MAKSIGLDYFLDFYQEIRERFPDMTRAEAIEAAKIAIFYEIHRDWLAKTLP